MLRRGAAPVATYEAARTNGCTRVRVTTTNDDLDAPRFYQRRGFRLVEVWPGAVDRSRRIKPEIPAQGMRGIPLRDELELARDVRGTAMQ